MENIMENQAKMDFADSVQLSDNALVSGNPQCANGVLLPDDAQLAQAQRVELIPVCDIVTGGYQRELTASRVARIVSAFNPAKLGVLVVNHREDGTYAILDGQHRLACLRVMGYQHARCVVLSGLTIQEEADYFRFQNENVRALTAFDLFNAGVHAKDPHYVTLKYLLEKYDFRANRSGGPHCIAAVDALSKITQLYGFSVLEQALAFISATWPTDTTIVRREMLAGMAEFVDRFGATVSVQTFAGRMSAKHPSDMLFEFQRRTQGRGTPRNAFNQTIRFTTCGVLVDAYNKGLSSGSRKKLNLVWRSSAIG